MPSTSSATQPGFSSTAEALALANASIPPAAPAASAAQLSPPSVVAESLLTLERLALVETIITPVASVSRAEQSVPSLDAVESHSEATLSTLANVSIHRAVPTASVTQPASSSAVVRFQPALVAVKEPKKPTEAQLELWRSAEIEGYPDSWRATHVNYHADEGAALERMKELSKIYAQLHIINPAIIRMDEHNRESVIPREIFSPVPGSDWERILVQRGKYAHQEMITIRLPDLPQYLAEGWEVWTTPISPIEKFTGRDMRKQTKRIEDVRSFDNPQNDTQFYFRDAIALSRVQDGLEWYPGQLLGNSSRAKAPIHTTREFTPPCVSGNDLSSATSRGHMELWPRPPGVGAGWGDYSLYREWQIHGRLVKKEWVKPGNWKKVDGSIIEFVPSPDSPPGTAGFTFNVQLDGPVDDDSKLPETLYEQMNRKSQKNRNGKYYQPKTEKDPFEGW